MIFTVLWDGAPTLTSMTKIKVLVWLCPSLGTRKKNLLLASKSFLSQILCDTNISFSWPLQLLQANMEA